MDFHSLPVPLCSRQRGLLMGTLASNLWRHNRLLLVAFSMALVLTLFFATKLLVFATHWMVLRSDPGPIAGWMTPRFLVHAYHLPPAVLEATLGFTFQRQDPQTLKQIAAAKGVPLTDLIAEIMGEIDKMTPVDGGETGGGQGPLQDGPPATDAGGSND